MRWAPLHTQAISALLARARLGQGRIDEALALASEVARPARSRRRQGDRSAGTLLACMEALEAAGRHDEALAAAREARRLIREDAEKIDDPSIRALFEARPHNARALQLARAWLSSSD
ncbi:MAG: hypothetical protein R3F14_07595 [Polyangiaceae bacterium]